MTSLISRKKHNGYLELASKNRNAPILMSPADWNGVKRAAHDLSADFERVTGNKTAVLESLPNTVPTRSTECAIIVGTRGKNPIIDDLLLKGKLQGNLSANTPEAYLIQTVENPVKGLDRALVIVGSDKRGTIYGIYEISRLIGVSPWYWWADVRARKSETLFVNPSYVLSDAPAVRYRGIFLNDEYPALTNWVREKFGEAEISVDPPVPANIANYGTEFYSRVFELLLRLKANYLWPAMWNNAFNEDDPNNARLADEYGIIMGTSHQEPMLRAQKEWDRRFGDTFGKWNYGETPEELEKFWREGIERNRQFESIVTIGLRGADDTEMSRGTLRENRDTLEKIVNRQRNIIAGVTGKKMEEVPQQWCLYKEVQEYYEDGMRVPDDVILLWSDDNWGNQRRLPTVAERARSGGAGIYYHFDYHGGPRSYQWTNTTTIAKIWDQMTLAREYGADRVWIVNAGHLKGYEYPVSFFMDLAWCPERYNGENIGQYTSSWATQLFGDEISSEVADIIELCARYNARRKPELLSPDTFSLLHYGEAERVMQEWKSLAQRAERLYEKCSTDMRDAVYQLVVFPVHSSTILYNIYISAGKNALWVAQGRVAANKNKQKALSLFSDFTALMKEYNTVFAHGKWAHFMDQSVLGYTGWADPPGNTLNHINLCVVEPKNSSTMGVALEGSASSWPNSTDQAILPLFDAFNCDVHWIEIFNGGNGEFAYSVHPSESWILVDKPIGTITDHLRLHVSIDWNRLPCGKSTGTIRIRGTWTVVLIFLEILKPDVEKLKGFSGFVETDLSLAMEAPHYSRNRSARNRGWTLVEGFGKTLSGMRATAEPNPPPLSPGKSAPCLEYDAWFYHTGKAKVILYLSPILNFIPGESVLIGVSFDDGSVETVLAVDARNEVSNNNVDWGKCVCDNIRLVESFQNIDSMGAHTIKIWMLSPGVVLERIIVDMGGLKPSYMGPPESYHTN